MTENIKQETSVPVIDKNRKQTNIFMLVIIIATIVSIILISTIAGIWYHLYSTNSLGREEQKSAHIAMFVLAIIDIVIMVMWIGAMIANIILFRKIQTKNKTRMTIHYIGTLACHIVFGCIAFVLLYNVITWKIMDGTGRNVAIFFIGFLEILRIALLLSVLVTSIIYLVKNRKKGNSAQPKVEVTPKIDQNVETKDNVLSPSDQPSNTPNTPIINN